MEFEQVYDLYFRDVYRYILKLSGSEHVAEEITSDTFFKALRSIGKFRGSCDMRVWLCQIAKNCYYTYLRKEKHTTPLEELPESVGSADTPEELIGAREEARQIQAILHDLPEPYREVFMWRVYAELSYKQIGELFAKSDNWACVTYHRAKNMIKTDWRTATMKMNAVSSATCCRCMRRACSARTAPPLSKSIWIHAKNAAHCPPVKSRPLPPTRTRSSAPVKPAFCGR